MKNIFITGGAGFIGGHFVDHLLTLPQTNKVTVYDCLLSGKNKLLMRHEYHPKLTLIKNNLHDLTSLIDAMKNHDTVIHLASNPDIARAVTEPTIDFQEGTCLTQNVLEAMRITKTKRILYASGSGVYGEKGEIDIHENAGGLNPISTYGASKLAGESLICAYANLFDMQGIAFRFGNVVGPYQTHGIGYDFIRKLDRDPNTLAILGDGTQSKSYVYITDIVSAVLCANKHCNQSFDVFNVATGDYITVKEIAEIAVSLITDASIKTHFVFSNTDRGWKGDVPIVRLNTDKIKKLGWRPQFNSRQAITLSIQKMLEEDLVTS